MRITAIAPGSFGPEEIAMRQRNLEALCSPGTSVRVVPVEGVGSVTNASSHTFLGPGVVRRAQEEERDGCDAVVIHCFGDPGLEAAKTLLNIPVVGASEAVLHVASLLANRFGIITFADNVIPSMRRRLDGYGMSGRIAAIKGINIPVLEFRRRTKEIETRFIELSREAIDEGAQVIIPGCLAILPALGTGSAARLKERLGVPVLDSSGIALRTGELLASLKIAQSKLAFPA